MSARRRAGQAMREAIADAALAPEPARTSAPMMCAPAGSGWMLHRFTNTTDEGPLQCHPMSLAAAHRGAASTSISSRPSRSKVPPADSTRCGVRRRLRRPFDHIRLGRQDRVFVVGAEDCNLYSILPFASLPRARQTQTDPDAQPLCVRRKTRWIRGDGRRNGARARRTRTRAASAARRFTKPLAGGKHRTATMAGTRWRRIGAGDEAGAG